MRRRGPGVRRVFRAFLALYPAPFRRDFGTDVADTHVDRYRSRRRRGRAAALVYALIAVGDLCWGAVHEWTEAGREAIRGRSGRRRMLPAAFHDLRFAARSLRRHPVFAATVVITVALGIGAGTAVFSLVDAVLLQPLPGVADPQSLVAIYDESHPDAPRAGVPFPTFRALQTANRSLAGLAAYTDEDVAFQAPGRSALVPVAIVSGDYFPLLGVHAQLGRVIGPEDDQAPLASPVVVLSDGVWTREFSRHQEILGQSVRLGPTSFTVVGVAPRGFRGTHLSRSPDFWVPLTMIQGLDLGGFLSGRFSRNLFTTFRGYGWLQLLGRLRPGVSPAAATTDLTHVLDSTRPTPASGARPEARAAVVPIATAAAIIDRMSVVRFVSLLVGVVGLILLLACLNVATLLRVRTEAWTRELGVCAALGASRGRLVGRLAAESLVLGTAGGLAGIALGPVVMRLLADFSLPGGIAIGSLDLSLDARVLTFACLLTLATTVVFGVGPALRVSRIDPVSAFRWQSRGNRGSGPRPGLLAAQVAISLVILVTAGLFIRSLRAGLGTNVGFDPRPVAAATIELRLHGYSSSRAAEFYRQVIDRLSETPGVQAAAVAGHVPLAPVHTFGLRPAGAPASRALLRMGRNHVSPGYFRAIGVPILAGRDFAATDTPKAPLVAMLSESAARALWPEGEAVGRQFVDFTDRAYTVIGIVRDTKYESLGDADPPFVFYSILQEVIVGKVHVIARDHGLPDPAAVVRAAILDVDPIVAPIDVRRLSDQVEKLLMPQRFGSVLLATLGLLAVVIAAVGIYATLAHTVAQRTNELGIRIALGAARADVLRLVMHRTARTIGAGVAMGLIAAAAVARTLAHFLYGVTVLDATAFIIATIVLASVVGAAGLIPAWRACRVDPIRALRRD